MGDYGIEVSNDLSTSNGIVLVRNSMCDDIVYAGTNRSREPLVPERRGICVMADDILVYYVVNRVCPYPWLLKSALSWNNAKDILPG